MPKENCIYNDSDTIIPEELILCGLSETQEALLQLVDMGIVDPKDLATALGIVDVTLRDNLIAIKDLGINYFIYYQPGENGIDTHFINLHNGQIIKPKDIAASSGISRNAFLGEIKRRKNQPESIHELMKEYTQ